MRVTLTGYTFRKTTARPTGQVDFRLEDNKYDAMAVACYFKDEHIGYLKKGSDEQEYAFKMLTEGRQPRATVVEYKFGFLDNGKMVFNDNHEGILMHVEIELEGHIGYNKDGETYISITNLLSYLNPTGTLDNLIRWAVDSFSNYNEYETALTESATDGTKLHKEIEGFFKGEKGFPAIENFSKKFTPEVVNLESTVFSDYGVAGTYDALFRINGKLVVVDWKSSKKPQLKQKIQGAFYACEVGADEAWVVTFGGDTKQGFSVCKVLRPEIDKYVKVIKALVNIYNLLNK